MLNAREKRLFINESLRCFENVGRPVEGSSIEKAICWLPARTNQSIAHWHVICHLAFNLAKSGRQFLVNPKFKGTKFCPDIAPLDDRYIVEVRDSETDKQTDVKRESYPKGWIIETVECKAMIRQIIKELWPYAYGQEQPPPAGENSASTAKSVSAAGTSGSGGSPDLSSEGD